ncbi:MAG: ATP:cob(I)alamin adenosyltransferase [Herbinix sp.]|jgi:ATP:cob(I)alamin adenosyltransferase|nr:ATP:cob(I)alamin adenosyltransferase [Herbinix sp.]
MSIYTKAGDKGMTSLAKTQNVSKSDDRIQLLGSLDELTSSLGLVKASETREEIRVELERIQRNLMTIMAGIADQFNKEYKMTEEETTHLEDKINQMEDSFPRKKEFILPGECIHSAQIDVARTITRRSERLLITVDKKFIVDSGSKKYINRLADYLYMLARYTDFLQKSRNPQSIKISNGVNQNMENNDIVQSVIDKIGLGLLRINLNTSKNLISRIEEQAAKLGLNAVIAICTPEGNPVAVHVMDGAYLASFDIAMKKAYTSVAVKMSTKELGELAKPGGTFYGIDKADNGKIIIFGGGIPLMHKGRMLGGLGISGGTAEEDASLAELGLSIFEEIL